MTVSLYFVTLLYNISERKLEIGDSIQKAIAVVVVVIVLLYMTDPIVDAVNSINTTDWDFTGHEGAEAILGLLPFLWVAAILGFAAYAMFRIATSKNG